jgi:hypothetical protein
VSSRSSSKQRAPTTVAAALGDLQLKPASWPTPSGSSRRSSPRPRRAMPGRTAVRKLAGEQDRLAERAQRLQEALQQQGAQGSQGARVLRVQRVLRVLKVRRRRPVTSQRTSSASGFPSGCGRPPTRCGRRPRIRKVAAAARRRGRPTIRARRRRRNRSWPGRWRTQPTSSPRRPGPRTRRAEAVGATGLAPRNFASS